MDWNDPDARFRLLKELGPAAYNAAHEAHIADSTIETVNGYRLRHVASQFGALVAVVGTDRAYSTVDQARDYARGLPAAPGDLRP